MMRIDYMSRGRREQPSQSHRRWARRATTMGIGGVNITLSPRKYAAAQNLSEEEALKKGMEEKALEFAESRADVFTKV